MFLRFSGVHLSDTRFHFSVCPSLELLPVTVASPATRRHLPSAAPIISASWSHLLGSCLIDCGASYRYTGSGCCQRTARLPRLVCLTALIERETAPRCRSCENLRPKQASTLACRNTETMERTRALPRSA